MLRPKPDAQVYLYLGIVDMRKSIDGLAALVEQELDLSLLSEALFVFCNRKRDKIKLLYWERNGFILGTNVWKSSDLAGCLRLPWSSLAS
jgi:transposase